AEEGIVAHNIGGAEYRVAQAERLLLEHVADVGHVLRVADRGQLGLLAARLEPLLELRLAVEVGLDQLLAVGDDQDHLAGAGRHRLLDRPLDDRAIDHREHLLGENLGRGEEAGAQSGGGDHAVANRAHRPGIVSVWGYRPLRAVRGAPRKAVVEQPRAPLRVRSEPMLDVRTELIRAVRAVLTASGVDDQVEAVVDRSARPEFGDFSTPAPLRAARVLRRRPIEIAEELRERLEALPLPFVTGWAVSPPGYVNCRLDDGVWATAVIDQALELDRATPLVLPGEAPPPGRTLVEHTATNPNKAAHVGHLRNACIGDSVARILRRLGQEVEVQNYIDDTGVQVAFVAVGLRLLGVAQGADEPFVQYCHRVYVEVGHRYEAAPALVEERRRTLREIETGEGETARFVKELASRVVDCHLATMRRFDIGYDLLTWESDIIALGFWSRAFD